MLTKDELEAGLAQCTGSEQYHRHWLKLLKYTDGVYWLAENAGAHWLIDAIASHQPDAAKNPRLREFQLWRLSVRADHTARLECLEDTDLVRITQEIEYTDFPLTEIKLYVTDGVLLLPSEN